MAVVTYPVCHNFALRFSTHNEIIIETERGRQQFVLSCLDDVEKALVHAKVISPIN